MTSDPQTVQRQQKSHYGGQIYLKSLNYSFASFGGLIWIFVYILAAQTSAGQTGPKFKKSVKVYERIIREILRRSGYFSKGAILTYCDGVTLTMWGSNFISCATTTYMVHLDICNARLKKTGCSRDLFFLCVFILYWLKKIMFEPKNVFFINYKVLIYSTFGLE